MSTNDLNTKIETAAVAEATRLCDNAFAGMARLAADPAVAPWLPSQEKRLTRAKQAQLHEFRPSFARIQRLVLDAFRDEFATREEFLAAVDLFCATGIAEVERRFRQAA